MSKYTEYSDHLANKRLSTEVMQLKTKCKEQQDHINKLRTIIELYKLKDENIELYYVSDSLLERQQAQQAITGIMEEIELLLELL